MPKKQDRTKDFYEKVVDAYTKRNFSRSRVELLRQFVRRLPKKNRQVIEAGCGTGRDVLWLKAHGVKDIVGIDFSQEMIKKAKEVVEADFRVMDVRDLKFNDGEIGGVTCLVTLVDLPKKDVPKTLKEFYRVLCPGGVLLVTVKEGDREYLETTSKYGLDYMIYPRHVSLFLASDLRKIVEQAGFTIIESTTYTDDSNTWVAVIGKK